MPQRIYDASSDIRFNRGSGVVTLVLGLALSGWYVSGITATIQGDIHNFPPAFRSSPALTIFFAIFKSCAYVLFGCLFALMVYVPARNIFFKRKFSGRLTRMSAATTKNGKRFLSIHLGQHVLTVPDTSGLEATLNDGTLEGQELRFTVGAFDRVIHIDTPTTPPPGFS